MGFFFSYELTFQYVVVFIDRYRLPAAHTWRG